MSERHHNGFDALRMGAAAAVIFSHHFALTRTPAPDWLNFGMVGGVAVMAFFAISGYLVMQSWLREPRVAPFVYKRLLRIWPGVAVAVVSNVLLFGLLSTTLPAAEFLRHPQTLDYWRNLLLYRAFVELPGTFAANPYPQVMNGPLWTIPMEALCYAALAAAGALGAWRSRAVASAVCLTYLIYFLWRHNADLTGEMRHWHEYSAHFAHGALLALHREHFQAHARGYLLTLLGLSAALLFGWDMGHSAALLLLPPLLVYLGTRPAAALAPLQRWGDPSYGVYLFGFPIAQTLQAAWPALPFAASLALTVLLAFAAGYASWHAVKARALRLKRWRPWRLGQRQPGTQPRPARP